MKRPVSPEVRSACEARLAEITDADTVALTEFAECRLVAVGAPPSHGEDIVQRAFHAVLMGLETDQPGRRPRPSDVGEKAAFLNYMRGAVSSLVYALTRKFSFRQEVGEWDDNTLPPGETTSALTVALEMRDLRAELFPRLRARAPSRLIATIDAWESEFLHSDRIPARGHRKHVGEVKDLARGVLSELGDLDKE